MANFKSVEDAREYFNNDRYAAMSGVYIEELGEGFSRCSMKITDTHINAAGGVMGGAIFTLADLALSAAANNVHMPTVAQQVSCSFLSTVKGDTLFAEAKCKKDGRTTCVYTIEVKDNTGRDIAYLVGTGYKL
ncbi:MAG: PaaI family thioesterase [Ruminococcus sp.]|nr:PaaI family thioesterase [Ruminococcus sp.]